MEKIACTVEILTWNSEKTLKACLESVKDFDDIIILDGNSTDKTLEIANNYRARIIKQVKTEESLWFTGSPGAQRIQTRGSTTPRTQGSGQIPLSSGYSVNKGYYGQISQQCRRFSWRRRYDS